MFTGIHGSPAEIEKMEDRKDSRWKVGRPDKWTDVQTNGQTGNIEVITMCKPTYAGNANMKCHIDNLT